MQVVEGRLRECHPEEATNVYKNTRKAACRLFIPNRQFGIGAGVSESRRPNHPPLSARLSQ